MPAILVTVSKKYLMISFETFKDAGIADDKLTLSMRNRQLDYTWYVSGKCDAITL